ncbi:MAG TPA: methyltransferase domain-containing protein [Micromonosporaceae bacterium]
MRHEHKIHDRHRHDGDRGDALTHGARRYEFGAAVGFLGRRRRVYDGLVALSGARPGDRVLDVGCGTGYLTRRVARAVAPDGYVVGVDPSSSVIGYAADHAPDNGAFEIARAQALPYADASFDVVVSSLAMHHVPSEDRAAALREMRRVLRPGGRLLIVDYREQPRHLVVANLIGALSRHAAQHSPADDLTELVADAGFRITAVGDRWPSLRYVQGERPGASGTN